VTARRRRSRASAFAFASGLALVASLALAGCSEDPPPAPAPPPPVTFGSEAPGETSVFLRGHAEGERAIVDVVARGAADVHGAAFRVRFDPATLSFVGATSGPSWSKQVIALAKEGTPGQLAVAWAERGATGIAAKDETVLGTLTFDVRAHRPTELAFRPERSAVIDRAGATVPVTWHGATVSIDR
jgi:hypothetical protein